MVNSESFGSDGNCPANDCVSQPNKGSDSSQSPSPVTASSACPRETDYTMQTAGSLPMACAIEPTATKTEFNSSMANLYGADAKQERETGLNGTNAAEDEEEEKPSLFVSLPLKKVQNVLGKSPEDEQKNRKPKKLMCLYCERTFVTTSLRQKHVDRCHSTTKNRRASQRFQNSTTACSYCGPSNTERNLRELFEHLTKDHGTKYFGCVSCEERFPSKPILNEHNLVMHDISTPSDTATEKFEDDSLDSSLDSVEDSAILSDKDDLSDSTRLNESEAEERLLRKRSNSRPKNSIKVLRSKKVPVRTAKLNIKKSKIQQGKIENKSTTKKRGKALKKVLDATPSTSKVEKPSQKNSFFSMENIFTYKKITDHSIDNLKISSLTFDDVFDKAFFNRMNSNIRDNLLNHIDGKLFKNKESESRISNFEKTDGTATTSENFGCEISLNAATPIPSTTLATQLGEEVDFQIEYGSKASKKKPQPVTNDEVHYKYFTRRKYQAHLKANNENRDLSKLDMWTQIVVKNRQQTAMDNNKTEKEMQEYNNGEEYKNKVLVADLNRILDKRGPFEDLKEEANKKLTLDKLNEGNIDFAGNNEIFVEVRSVVNDLLDKLENECVVEVKQEKIDEETNENMMDADVAELLCLRRTNTLNNEPDVDQSDKITLICSSQETENFEANMTPRDKNTLVQLSGEWTRSRIYICAACGFKLPNIKFLLEHKNIVHPNVMVQHYEFVGNQSELYRHLSIPGMGKVGYVEENPTCKQWRRSDARTCTKCKKQCNSLGELHRHILECGEDWTWMFCRKKCKYKPFGSKSRRKRRAHLRPSPIKNRKIEVGNEGNVVTGLIKRIFQREPKPQDDTQEKKKIKKVEGPRIRPSDAETIQRMLANLPAKRATRKLISMKDGFNRPNKKVNVQIQKPSMAPLKKSSQLTIRQRNKAAMLENTVSEEDKVHRRKIPERKAKCNPAMLRKSFRNLNKVFVSKILDTSANLPLRRRLKSAVNQNRQTESKKEEETLEEDVEKVKIKPKNTNKKLEEVAGIELENSTNKKSKTSPVPLEKVETKEETTKEKVVKKKGTLRKLFTSDKESKSKKVVSKKEKVPEKFGRKLLRKLSLRKKVSANKTSEVANNDVKETVDEPKQSEEKPIENKQEIVLEAAKRDSETVSDKTDSVKLKKGDSNTKLSETKANNRKRKTKNSFKSVVKKMKLGKGNKKSPKSSNSEEAGPFLEVAKTGGLPSDLQDVPVVKSGAVSCAVSDSLTDDIVAQTISQLVAKKFVALNFTSLEEKKRDTKNSKAKKKESSLKNVEEEQAILEEKPISKAKSNRNKKENVQAKTAAKNNKNKSKKVEISTENILEEIETILEEKPILRSKETKNKKGKPKKNESLSIKQDIGNKDDSAISEKTKEVITNTTETINENKSTGNTIEVETITKESTIEILTNLEENNTETPSNLEENNINIEKPITESNLITSIDNTTAQAPIIDDKVNNVEKINTNENLTIESKLPNENIESKQTTVHIAPQNEINSEKIPPIEASLEKENDLSSNEAKTCDKNESDFKNDNLPQEMPIDLSMHDTNLTNLNNPTVESTNQPVISTIKFPIIDTKLKSKLAKRTKGLNDCIAMLTNKLQQKPDVDEKCTARIEEIEKPVVKNIEEFEIKIPKPPVVVLNIPCVEKPIIEEKKTFVEVLKVPKIISSLERHSEIFNKLPPELEITLEVNKSSNECKKDNIEKLQTKLENSPRILDNTQVTLEKSTLISQKLNDESRKLIESLPLEVSEVLHDKRHEDSSEFYIASKPEIKNNHIEPLVIKKKVKNAAFDNLEFPKILELQKVEVPDEKVDKRKSKCKKTRKSSDASNTSADVSLATVLNSQKILMECAGILEEVARLKNKKKPIEDVDEVDAVPQPVVDEINTNIVEEKVKETKVEVNVEKVKLNRKTKSKKTAMHVEEPKHVEEQSKHVEKQAQHIEEQPKLVEEQPKHVEEQLKHVEDQPKHVDDQPKLVDDQPKHVEEQQKLVEEHKHIEEKQVPQEQPKIVETNKEIEVIPEITKVVEEINTNIVEDLKETVIVVEKAKTTRKSRSKKLTEPPKIVEVNNVIQALSEINKIVEKIDTHIAEESKETNIVVADETPVVVNVEKTKPSRKSRSKKEVEPQTTVEVNKTVDVLPELDKEIKINTPEESKETVEAEKVKTIRKSRSKKLEESPKIVDPIDAMLKIDQIVNEINTAIAEKDKEAEVVDKIILKEPELLIPIEKVTSARRSRSKKMEESQKPIDEVIANSILPETEKIIDEIDKILNEEVKEVDVVVPIEKPKSSRRSRSKKAQITVEEPQKTIGDSNEVNILPESEKVVDETNKNITDDVKEIDVVVPIAKQKATRKSRSKKVPITIQEPPKTIEFVAEIKPTSETDKIVEDAISNTIEENKEINIEPIVEKAKSTRKSRSKKSTSNIVETQENIEIPVQIDVIPETITKTDEVINEKIENDKEVEVVIPVEKPKSNRRSRSKKATIEVVETPKIDEKDSITLKIDDKSTVYDFDEPDFELRKSKRPKRNTTKITLKSGTNKDINPHANKDINTEIISDIDKSIENEEIAILNDSVEANITETTTNLSELESEVQGEPQNKELTENLEDISKELVVKKTPVSKRKGKGKKGKRQSKISPKVTESLVEIFNQSIPNIEESLESIEKDDKSDNKQTKSKETTKIDNDNSIFDVYSLDNIDADIVNTVSDIKKSKRQSKGKGKLNQVEITPKIIDEVTEPIENVQLNITSDSINKEVQSEIEIVQPNKKKGKGKKSTTKVEIAEKLVKESDNNKELNVSADICVNSEPENQVIAENKVENELSLIETPSKGKRTRRKTAKKDKDVIENIIEPFILETEPIESNVSPTVVNTPKISGKNKQKQGKNELKEDTVKENDISIKESSISDSEISAKVKKSKLFEDETKLEVNTDINKVETPKIKQRKGKTSKVLEPEITEKPLEEEILPTNTLIDDDKIDEIIMDEIDNDINSDSSDKMIRKDKKRKSKKVIPKISNSIFKKKSKTTIKITEAETKKLIEEKPIETPPKPKPIIAPSKLNIISFDMPKINTIKSTEVSPSASLPKLDNKDLFGGFKSPLGLNSFNDKMPFSLFNKTFEFPSFKYGNMPTSELFSTKPTLLEKPVNVEPIKTPEKPQESLIKSPKTANQETENNLAVYDFLDNETASVNIKKNGLYSSSEEITNAKPVDSDMQIGETVPSKVNGKKVDLLNDLPMEGTARIFENSEPDLPAISNLRKKKSEIGKRKNSRRKIGSIRQKKSAKQEITSELTNENSELENLTPDIFTSNKLNECFVEAPSFTESKKDIVAMDTPLIEKLSKSLGKRKRKIGRRRTLVRSANFVFEKLPETSIDNVKTTENVEETPINAPIITEETKNDTIEPNKTLINDDQVQSSDAQPLDELKTDSDDDIPLSTLRKSSQSLNDICNAVNESKTSTSLTNISAEVQKHSTKENDVNDKEKLAQSVDDFDKELADVFSLIPDRKNLEEAILNSSKKLSAYDSLSDDISTRTSVNTFEERRFSPAFIGEENLEKTDFFEAKIRNAIKQSNGDLNLLGLSPLHSPINTAFDDNSSDDMEIEELNIAKPIQVTQPPVTVNLVEAEQSLEDKIKEAIRKSNMLISNSTSPTFEKESIPTEKLIENETLLENDTNTSIITEENEKETEINEEIVTKRTRARKSVNSYNESLDDEIFNSDKSTETIITAQEESNDSTNKSTLKKSKTKKGKGVSSPKKKPTKPDNVNLDTYCEICNKNFARNDNLLKHKMTFTHIAKLSELEAKEAAEKAKLQEIENIEDNIDDISKLTEAEELTEKEQFELDINLSKMLQKSDEVSAIPKNILVPNLTGNNSMKLADIINDVLNKPVTSVGNFSETNTSIPEPKRYKSLGERKSFDSDTNINCLRAFSPDSTDLPNTDSILEKQISLLENIIEENKVNFQYLDEESNKSLSNLSNSKMSDSNTELYQNNSKKVSEFVKPSNQFDEISEDSTATLKMQYDENRARKALNRDEELFLECCSLLKSSSEVSSYSKKTNSIPQIKDSFNFKPVDEPDWFEEKDFPQEKAFSSNSNNDSDVSRMDTPIGESFADDYSNSNTVSTEWQPKTNHHKNKEKTASKKSEKKVSLNNFHLLNFGKKNDKTFEEKETSNKKQGKYRGTKESSSCQKSDVEDPKQDNCDKKMLTKGAMKVFEGLKVSIPTDELNMTQVLNCSPTCKKADIDNQESLFENKQEVSEKSTSAFKDVKDTFKKFGNKLGLKITKKKSNAKSKKTENFEEEKKSFDVYDFEETQDNTDVFSNNALPDLRTFRNQTLEKRNEINENVSQNQSDSESKYGDSFSFEAQSLSSYSSQSSSSLKETKPKQITKKKCMIMGRIFKNAIKTKTDDSTKDTTPSSENTETESYSINGPNYKEDEIKKNRLSNQEMNILFDKLLEDAPNKKCEFVAPLPAKVDSKKLNAKKLDAAITKSLSKARSKFVKRKRTKQDDSSDDEFNLNKPHRKRSNKKKEEDGINLEQELKECIGVASRKSQRKCTSGKQNVLIEFWSSDESNFDAILEAVAESKKIEPKLPQNVEETVVEDTVQIIPSIAEVVKTKQNEIRKIEKPKPVRRKSNSKHKHKPDKRARKSVPKTSSDSLVSSRQKRSASDTLYYWSSSSEDDFQDLIEVKPIRDEPEDEDRPVQHGWIVGDSPKKLVTMLAQAKGKKVDAVSVKEQNKKRTSV